MVAKLTKEPPLKRTKEGDAPKPSSAMSRSTKQAMRMKCNTIISLQQKKILAHLNYFCLFTEDFSDTVQLSK